MSERHRPSYLIAATLDPVERGQDFIGVPHMTVVRWFERPSDWSELKETIAKRFTIANPFGSPVGAEHAEYGPNKDIPVRELEGVSPLPYIGLQALVKRLGSRLTDELYAGEFLPHITDTPTKAVEEGELITFSSIAIVRRNRARTKQAFSFVLPIINEVSDETAA